MYYLRMRQSRTVREREVWAWSSPVWVRKPGARTALGPLLASSLLLGAALGAAGLRVRKSRG
jgi:hypothetical protein